MEEYLLDKLENYAENGRYPLHMPGHKRNIRLFGDPYRIDITEIDGFDNLFHAEGVLMQAQQRAARLYGAEETYYLINGSTCGILSAVSAAVRHGGRLLMARNCHKAAYHAALINNLQVTYLYPETDMEYGMQGSIRPETVEQALRQPEGKRIEAVLLPSPTYDGVVSDLASIAKAVHRAGAVLIVDEAHGAHFAMHPYFPETALRHGADLVINSLHKTMPSLTQTALLHVQGTRVDRDRLRRYLSVYQSSSPSYVLMAGMDACVRLMETQRNELFDLFVRRLEALREELGRLRRLHLITGHEPGLFACDYDRSKIVISTAHCRLNGPELGRILKETYHLEPEMEAEQYVTAILTAADTAEGMNRLRDALLEIDAGLLDDDRCPPVLSPKAENEEAAVRRKLPRPETVLTMREAEERPQGAVALAQSGGRISAELVYLYPPGIPLLVPGERIPEEMPALLAHSSRIGLQLLGLKDRSRETIAVVCM